MPSITTPKKLKQSRAQAIVTFTDAEVAVAEKKALERIGANIRIEGFRPGKAPEDMLRSKIDPAQLQEETVRMLLPGVFDTLLKEHQLKPIIPPKVDMTATKPMTLTVTFVEKPEVKVKGADKITVKKAPVTIDKKDVDRMVDYLRQQYRTTSPADRPAKDGDEVMIDFVGNADGKELEGTRATGYRLALGSKSLIPGFEEAVVGMKKGDTKTFNVVFPSDYHAKHLQKKPVDFTVTLHQVSELTMPEFTDAFVKEHHLGESAKDLEAKIEKTLKDQREGEDRAKREKELFEAIRSATVIDLAPELILHEERMLVDEIAHNLENSKMTMEDWLKSTNRTPETMRKEMTEEATKRLTLRFAIQWLLEEKKIEVDTKEIDADREMMIAGAEPNRKAQAEQYYKEGSEGYEELKWRKRVEKMVEQMLAA